MKKKYINSSQLDLHIQWNFNQTFSKLLCDYWHTDSNVDAEKEETQNWQHNFEKEQRGLTPFDYAAYYKDRETKTFWYWWNNRPLGKWGIIESPVIDPHKYSQLSLMRVQRQFIQEI